MRAACTLNDAMTVSIHLHSSKLFTDYNKMLYNPTYNVVKLETYPVRAHTHTHTPRIAQHVPISMQSSKRNFEFLQNAACFPQRVTQIEVHRRSNIYIGRPQAGQPITNTILTENVTGLLCALHITLWWILLISSLELCNVRTSMNL